MSEGISKKERKALRRVRRKALISLILLTAVAVLPLIFSRHQDFDSVRNTTFGSFPLFLELLEEPWLWLEGVSIFLVGLALLNLYAVWVLIISSENSKPKRILKRIKRLESVRFFTFLIFMYALLNATVVSLASVSGPSMQPTVFDGDDVLMFHYDVAYQRHNIVVVQVPTGLDYSYFIKRIVGLPGETVRIENGQVFIDDVALDEPYLDGPTPCPPQFSNYCEIELGAGEYYILGDNRSASNDSRNLGAMDEDQLFGRVVYRIRPIRRMGSVD
jgi:signal peptidase I